MKTKSKEFHFKIAGSGTIHEIISALERLAVDLSDEIDNVYYDGRSIENETLICEISKITMHIPE